MVNVGENTSEPFCPNPINTSLVVHMSTFSHPQAGAPGPDDSAAGGPHEWLSAAVDGQPSALGPACQAWRDDAQARATWHRYHLIGDVMRSQELASKPARDAAFLQAIRQRLVAEPVVLAPVVIAPSRTRPNWWAGAAAAAGVAAVAGVLVVSRLSAPTDAATPPQALAEVTPPAAVPAPSSAQLIRDAGLDEYLRAHQSARGGVGAAVPGSALRRVELEMPAGAAR
jgi:sigma-E factor negative regulatory protein RseA